MFWITESSKRRTGWVNIAPKPPKLAHTLSYLPGKKVSEISQNRAAPWKGGWFPPNSSAGDSVPPQSPPRGPDPVGPKELRPASAVLMECIRGAGFNAFAQSFAGRIRGRRISPLSAKALLALIVANASIFLTGAVFSSSVSVGRASASGIFCNGRAHPCYCPANVL